MRRVARFFGRLAALLAVAAAPAARAQTTLVLAGQPQAVILTAPNPKGYVTMAAQELQKHLQLMSGALVPIDTVGHEGSHAGKNFIYVGASTASTAAGISTTALSVEFYVIKTVGSNLYIVGKDGGTDDWTDLTNCWPGTMFGVYHFLGEILGVRWLWPGDLGIAAPATPSITVPALNLMSGPAMVQRKYRMPRISLYAGGATTYTGSSTVSIPVLPASASVRSGLANDDTLWLRRQRMGTRKNPSFGSSETTWWSLYGTTHPEYFAVLPAGKSQPSPEATEVKLHVNSPAVWAQIIANWTAAKKPNNLNLCPNDSRSFCTDPLCLSWDSPSQPASIVYNDSSALLGDRYARFYTEIANEAKALNPNVTIYGYAYDTYRNAPLTAMLPDNVAIDYIPGSPTDVVPALIQETQTNVLGWIAHGCTQMYLRPNWFLAAHAGPFLPLHRAGNHYAAMLAGGYLLGLDSDSSCSSYSGFGLYYYLFCRLMSNPAESVDSIIAEYCSGFGSAAGTVSNYFAYWENFINAQADAGNTTILGYASGMAAYPASYTDSVWDGAEGILNDAEAQLGPTETAARARIDFLRVACDHGRLTAHAIALVDPNKTLANNPAAEAAMRAVLAYRTAYAGSFAIWREWMIDRESYGVPNMGAYWSAILANPTPAKPSFVGPAAAAGGVGAAFSYQVVATNSPTSYSATPLPNGLSIDGTTGLISGTPSAAGTTTVTLAAVNALGTSTSTLTLTVPASAPAITSAASASASLGAPFSYQVIATNSPTDYTAAPLPDGLAIDSFTGLISGTPTTVGTTAVTLGAANGAGAGATTLTITVAGAAPTLTGAGTASGSAGVAFTYQIAATAAPTSYSAAPLPAGLTVDPASGVISGIPTALGTTTVTLGATNDFGTGTGTLTLTIGSGLGNLYAGAVAGSNDDWNEPSSAGKKWASASAPASFVTPTAGNVYHLNGNTLRAGHIGINVDGGAPGVSGFGGQQLAIDSYDAASGQPANATLGGLIFELASTANGPHLALSTVTQGHYTADLVTDPLSVPESDGVATAVNTLRVIQAGTGVTILDGTLVLNGDTQFKLPSNVSDMQFTINSPVTGTGRIELAGGSAGGTTVNGFVVWVFNHLAGDGATPGSGWQGSSINVTNKHTLGIGADTNFFVTNPGATLALATGTTATAAASGYLNLRGNLSVGAGKLIVGTAGGKQTPSVVANGIYTVNDLNAKFPGLATEGSFAGDNLSSSGTTYKVYVGQGLPVVPAITDAGSTSGVVGTPFSFQVTASNSPVSYAVAAGTPLPDGLSIDAPTGLISGLPTAAGTTVVTLNATNSAGTGTATLTITVGAPLLPPTLGGAATASGQTGTPFSYQIVATGSPGEYDASPLPDGLTVDATTGLISGTPTTAGTTVVTLSATNGGGAGTATLTITLAGVAPAITSAAAASGTVGAAFSYQIAATAAPASYAAAPLPDGLSVDPGTGLISGTPTAAGTTAVTLSATNATGTGTAALTLAVAGVPPVITSGNAASGAMGSAFSYRITATGAPASYSAAPLPAGLSLDAASGLIGGTPTAAGIATVTLGATNAAGTGTAELSLTITGASAAHAVLGAGYIAGQTLAVTNTFTFTGPATNLKWSVLLPAGWSFAAATGAVGEVGPVAGQTDELDWTWANPPASPVVFNYTLNVPAGTTGAQSLTALVNAQIGTSEPHVLAQPDPLVVNPGLFHSADVNGDGKISLLELTRVIELYNTRQGTVRTGAYIDQPSSEDGFASDPTRTLNQPVALDHYHSADENRDGQIGLLDLTRVIELYNYRDGTVRTGQYHVQSGTEDGFAPGP